MGDTLRLFIYLQVHELEAQSRGAGDTYGVRVHAYLTRAQSTDHAYSFRLASRRH